MCGIVGYVGKNEKKEILLDGLQELEYRGYDSAGIAIIENKQLKNFKAIGRLQNLRDKTKDYKSEGFGVSIGHTRWATHGKPTELNAHPHMGAYSFVVHNGIIENYQALKDELQAEGVKFLSQTDTETIVHLFEKNHNINNNPWQSFQNTIDKLGIDISSAKIHTKMNRINDLFLIEKNGNFCNNTKRIIKELTES